MAIEGKTKFITPTTVGLVESKNDITAGDGVKHDIMMGKAALATSTTCNIFELLQRRELPVAYIGRGPTATSFYTQLCKMIPVEVVVRRVPAGSHLKRFPDIEAGTRFDELVVEFFYKTTARQLAGKELPCDDPLMLQHADGTWHLYLPDKLKEQAYIGPLECSEHLWTLRECGTLAKRVFEILEQAWYELGGELWDFKLEFGILEGNVVIADVIDCDSWRVFWHGIQLSKQGYRDGDNLAEVLRVYKMTDSLVEQML